MNDNWRNPEAVEEMPRAKVTVRHRRFLFVWIVPVVAAIITGFLVYDRVRDFGPKITIKFKDGSGVRTGQTPIKYRGVPIGEVTAVDLSEDQQYVLVGARLKRSAAPIARDTSVFWIVRPELDVGNVTGLSTVISGPEIQVLPGSGEPRSEFVGLERAPVAFDSKGLRVVLRTGHPGSLRRNSPVYYRGVEVGVVQDVDLGADAATAELHVLIRQRYASLVRSGSVFWNVSGANVSAGLFRGVEIKVESLRSLMTGGIAFATPNNPSARPVKDGTVFALHRDAKKEWLQWAPRIAIPPEKDLAESPPRGPQGDSRG